MLRSRAFFVHSTSKRVVSIILASQIKELYTMKSRFEEMGGTYTEIDGIFYPNLALPEPDPRTIGK